MTQLTDRLVWDKVTVKDRTTVMVDAPFLGICGAVHMQELMNALGESDPLGLRDRLLIMYERPRFVRSAQLQEACEKIPGSTLHGYLANVFWKLHVLHHPEHSPAKMEDDLNYKWLHYTFGDEAAQLFWGHFDEQASEQELNYRVDQQAAKKAGKGKTKHFRLALPIHNLVQAFQDTPLQDWNFQVSLAATKASALFCKYMDDVFASLDLLRKAGKIPAEPNPEALPQKTVKAKSNLESFLREVLGASMENTLPMPDMHIIRQMATAVCVSQKAPVMRHSDVHHLKAVIALNLSAERLNQNSPRAFRLLHLLGLGQATLSTNASGTKCALFTKIPTEMMQHPTVVTVLQTFLVEGTFQTQNIEAIKSVRKSNQAEIEWPNFDDATVTQEILHKLQIFVQLLARGWHYIRFTLSRRRSSPSLHAFVKRKTCLPFIHCALSCHLGPR